MIWIKKNLNGNSNKRLISRRGPLCTRPTRLAGFFIVVSSLKQQSANRHAAPLGHIIMIPSQPVFPLSP